jgi:hypothetical protein
MNMEHRFTYPKVTEIRNARPERRVSARAVSQRALVTDSLIRCPNPSSESKGG